MDLGTIKSRIEDRELEDPFKIAKLIRRTFNNAMKFNPPVSFLVLFSPLDPSYL